MTAINHALTSSSLGLTRHRVLHAAVDLIDRDGLPALTMRRLGQMLGVEGMALYHYVTGRDDLLDGVVAVVTTDAATVSLPISSKDWRHYLRRLSAELRRVLIVHPSVFPLLATHPAAAQWWLRAPLLDSAWHQDFIGTLRRCGFADTGASTAYRVFTSFLTGQLLLDSASLTTHPLNQDPQFAQRRLAESQTDFDTTLDRLIQYVSDLQMNNTPTPPTDGTNGAAATQAHALPCKSDDCVVALRGKGKGVPDPCLTTPDSGETTP